MLSDQTILIEDGKIMSEGASAEAKIPSDAVRIDLPNATVLPGMIDAHTHLTMNPQFGYETLAISVPREALIGAKNARLRLMAGLTTVRNVGASGYSDVALRDAINAGDVPGPRMLVSGPALGITGGHCDNNMLPSEYHAVGDGVADGIAAVQHKGPREHQVWRGCDKSLRNRRSAVAGRQSPALAVHHGRDEGHCR
jgi:imidazolonepropionase-like amidohydrolase